MDAERCGINQRSGKNEQAKPEVCPEDLKGTGPGHAKGSGQEVSMHVVMTAEMTQNLGDHTQEERVKPRQRALFWS